MTLRIGTDGACSGNPGPAGWAWVAEDGTYAAGAFAHATNNIAELTALKMAIADHPDDELVIEYDSKYAYGCVVEWGPSWRRKGPKAYAGKKNVPLIFEVIDLIEAHATPIRWEWVKGHDLRNTYPLNTVADRISAEYSTKRVDIEVDRGTTEIDWARRGR